MYNCAKVSPLKIIYITVSMPYGAGEQFFIPEVKAMLSHGHDILIVPRSPHLNLINDDAKDLTAVSLPKSLMTPEILVVAFCEALRHPVRCCQIIHTLFTGSNIGVLIKNLVVLPKSLWLANLVKKVGADHIHAQWSSTTATMAMIAGWLSGTPWSFTAHRGDIANNNLLEIKIRKASFNRFISRSGLEMAKDICCRPVKGYAHIIHMGVQMPSVTHSLRPESKGPVILCPANLIPVKGHQYLLEALSILCNRGVKCLLHLAGQGKLRGQLEEQVKTLQITQYVTFLGQIPHDELLKLYREGKISIVVLPSIDRGNNEHEGIPVSLMEAMSYGIPCISTTTGGITELLGNGAGVLVPQKEPLALADAIQELLQDNQLRNKIAENGYSRVRDEFNVEKSVESLISLITDSSKPKPGCFYGTLLTY